MLKNLTLIYVFVNPAIPMVHCTIGSCLTEVVQFGAMSPIWTHGRNSWRSIIMVFRRRPPRGATSCALTSDQASVNGNAMASLKA